MDVVMNVEMDVETDGCTNGYRRSIDLRAPARSRDERFPTLLTTTGRICTRLWKNLRQESLPFRISEHKQVISIGLRSFSLGFKRCRCGDGDDDDDDDGVCFFLHDPHTLQQLGSLVIDFALRLLPQHYASRDVRIIHMHLLQLLLLQLHACAVARAPLDSQASRFLLQSAIKEKINLQSSQPKPQKK